MMRWLDALGAFKWPSLALIASPLVAYPFWLPETGPALACGHVIVDGHVLAVYRAASSDEAILRPTSTTPPRSAPVITVREPIGFDAGGTVVDAAILAGAGVTCPALTGSATERS